MCREKENTVRSQSWVKDKQPSQQLRPIFHGVLYIPVKQTDQLSKFSILFPSHSSFSVKKFTSAGSVKKYGPCSQNRYNLWNTNVRSDFREVHQKYMNADEENFVLTLILSMSIQRTNFYVYRNGKKRETLGSGRENATTAATFAEKQARSMTLLHLATFDFFL